MRGPPVRGVGMFLLSWAALSCDAAGCPVGRSGECTDDGCCTDDQQPPVAWNLTALAGDKQIPGPQAGPVGKQYIFSLLSNVAEVPRICQEFDPPVIAFNALEYDTSTNKTEDMCKPIGCDVTKHTSWDGLHVKMDPHRGLLLQYINPELGESWLEVNLVCQCDVPDDPSGLGFPENLHQEGDEKKWRMTWNTKYVCGSCPPPKPRTPTPKPGGAGWGTAVVIVFVLLAVLGAGGFAMWKKNGHLPCMKSGSALEDHLNAQLDAETPDWRPDSSGNIGGAE